MKCNILEFVQPLYDSLLTFLHILQGDEEKSQGLTPMPMMDRDKKDELPHLEVPCTLIKHVIKWFDGHHYYMMDIYKFRNKIFSQEIEIENISYFYFIVIYREIGYRLN